MHITHLLIWGSLESFPAKELFPYMSFYYYSFNAFVVHSLSQAATCMIFAFLFFSKLQTFRLFQRWTDLLADFFATCNVFLSYILTRKFSLLGHECSLLTKQPDRSH